LSPGFLRAALKDKGVEKAADKIIIINEVYMSEFMSYDPWSNIKTRNGISGDEIISMLQKSIRRALERNALAAAYEMYITSPQFEDKLWRRLLSISVEDIGFGDAGAPNLVYTLSQMRKEFLYQDGDRPMFFVHAIRYLCRCKKERSSDHIKNMLIKDFSHGRIPEIPEYALDLHTRRGREMGRDEVHFLTEASRVIPQLEGEDIRAVYEEYLEYCKKEGEDAEKGGIAPFEYNSWQY
jgi:replication-associated recombination protein RarA